MMVENFYSRAHQLVQQGVPFVTAIVVRAERPTSAKPGDKAIITADGLMHGWIGGSCAQPTVIREGLQALAADEARLIRLSTEPGSQPARAGVVDLPMTCYSGGTLEIYIEPHHPRPRLLIVGNLPVARALSELGRAMNYHVIVADPGGSPSALTATADELVTDLNDLAAQIRPYTYVVVATHGAYDELALEKILRVQPTYVGLVASPRRAASVRAYLLEQAFSETDLLPLKAPAGLDIGARRGDEIALSIMAEIVQRHRQAESLDLALLSQPAAGAPAEASSEARESRAAVAIDPICGMELTVAEARFSYEHEGETYYFCCPGCRHQFAQDPLTYTESSRSKNER